MYVYVGGSGEDTVRVLEQAPDGTLSEVQLIVDDAILELDNNFGEFTIATAGGAEFLIVHGFNDDGISVFQIGNDGQLTNTFNVDDSAALGLGLNGVYDTDSVRIGNTTFVLATGNFDDALTVFELSASGTLLLRSSTADNTTLELNGASGVASIVIGGTAYIYVAGNTDDGISIFELDSNGTSTNIGNITNDSTLAIDGARDIDIFTFNGTNFLVVTGQNSDGVSYFEIGTDGGLTLLDSVFDSDDVSLALNGIIEAEFFEVDGQGFVAVTGEFEDSITIFQVDADDGPIVGTEVADVLVGTLRDDEINDLCGDDVIVGIDGDDTLNGEGGSDVITGGDGDDVIRGDGDQSQTGSNVETITETCQDLALTVTLPDSNNGSTIEISGVINRRPAESSEFNIVYVIDISGSMLDQFVGTETVGDLNGDGSSNTLLDGTIAAFQALNSSIVDAGFGSSDGSVVIFDDASSVFVDSTALFGIDNALSSLRVDGGTKFEAALQTTITALNNAGEGENVVYFLSDGENLLGGSFADEVATLIDPNGLNATINSIGLGTDVDLPQLDLVDDGLLNDSAIQVLTSSTLTAGITGSPVATSEVDRLEVRVNGVLQRTLDDTEFAITPLGLRYDLVVNGLSTTAGDVIEVVLVASDTGATEVAVSLTVPNAVQDVGDDVLIGGNGNDQIEGNSGNDSLIGGNGDDGLVGGGRAMTLPKAATAMTSFLLAAAMTRLLAAAV
ncbi:beta-propeller fold lactonase family protein [Tateyamaria sp.]|uniref:beta-propeller fold lactonase family protein n=1 Tax=Tateyamaria sp. TaxID=1929288 RepID=UPI00329AB16A